MRKKIPFVLVLIALAVAFAVMFGTSKAQERMEPPPIRTQTIPEMRARAIHRQLDREAATRERLHAPKANAEYDSSAPD